MNSKMKSFSYKRLENEWFDNLKVQDDRTAHPTHPINRTENESLNQLCCPNCYENFEITKLKVKDGTHFSNLQCKTCKEVTSSRSWLCECGIPWIKCRRHFLRPKRSRENEACSHKTKIRRRKLGNDNPLPKCMDEHVMSRPIDIISAPHRPIGLKPGSKLGMKFPHLVKGASPIKWGSTGEGL